MEKVALYRKGEYVVGMLHGEQRHFFVESEIQCNIELLKEDGYTREIIDRYPQVKYDETETSFIISPSDFLCEKLSLPVVVKYFDNYRYVGKNHEFMVLKDTEMNYFYSSIECIKQDLRKKKIKEQVKKEGGIAFVSAKDAALLDGFYTYPIGIYGYVVVDVDNISSLQLTLKVPRGFVGRVVGRGGENVKTIARDVRVNRINVVPM